MHPRTSVCNERSRHRGMSLIELLMVVAIISVLIGLMLPAIQKVRMVSRRMQSANNLKQMSLAVNAWYAEHLFLPPTCGWDNASNKTADGGGNGTVFFLILPFLEQNSLYQQFYGPLDMRCSASDPVPQPIGVSAYRANRLALIPNVGPNPKQFTSPLDKSTPPYSVWTTTSYLANQTLLDTRIGIEKVSNGASNTMLLTEGLRTCGGSVWDPLNYVNNGTTTTYNTTYNGQPWIYSYTQGNGSFQVSRVNNWAVSSEVWDSDLVPSVPFGKPQTLQNLQAGIISKLTVFDYTSPLNPKPVIYDIQSPIFNVSSDCVYCDYGCGPFATANPGPNPPTVLPAYGPPSYVKGQIPAFSKVDPYYEPWSNFTLSASINATPGNNGSWNFSPTTTNNVINPLANPMRATYQDGRSWYVNPSLTPQGTEAPPTNCLWFGAQAHYGDLLVAMLDGSVHSVGQSVSADSWNAAISPYVTAPVGPDFFDN